TRRECPWPRSVTARRVDNVGELPAAREPDGVCESEVERHRHVFVVVVRRAVRGNVDVGHTPQGIAGGQRLRVEHVEDRAGQMPGAQGAFDRGLVEYGAAANVEQASAVFHEAELAFA